jgi:CubicO group peptidase (beta-lactamase class C family)
LRRRPGERVKYSNLGVGLLGDALARAAGQPYEALVRARICLPLGMRDTVVAPTGEQIARLATGYTRRRRPAPPFEIPALVGAGVLRSTATDTCCACCGLTSTLPRPPWRPRSSAPASPAAGGKAHRGRARLADRAPASGCRPRAVAQRRDQRLSQLVGAAREAGTAVVVLSNTARSVDRLGLRLLKALASAAG